MMEKRGRFRPGRALYSAGWYAANSVYQGYMGLYYVHLGLGSGGIGLIGAAASAAALVFQPLWGWLGDRVRSRRKLLGLLSLAAALALPAALAGKGLAVQMGAAAIFYAFFCALLPLNDAILLQSGSGFGAYRLAGGVSFALTGALFGLVRGRLFAGAAVLCASALLAMAAGAALLLPKAPGSAAGRGGMIALLKQRDLRRLLGIMLPLQMCMAFFHSFFGPRFHELGGGSALLGLSWMIATASEAPYLLLSGRIYGRFGAEAPMCIAAGIMALRWLMLGLANSPAMAAASQLLHGGGFIVISVSMAKWIADHVPEGMQATGQGLLNMVTFGVARVLGNLLGGAAAQRWGSDAAFLMAAALSAAAGLAMLPGIIRRRST